MEYYFSVFTLNMGLSTPTPNHEVSLTSQNYSVYSAILTYIVHLMYMIHLWGFTFIWEFEESVIHCYTE